MDGTGTGGWMSMEGNNTNWAIYGNVFEQTAKGGGYGHGTFADNMQAGTVTTGIFLQQHDRESHGRLEIGPCVLGDGRR